MSTGNAFTEPAAKTSDAIVAFDMKTGKMLWWYQGVENDASPQGCNGPRRGEQCPENARARLGFRQFSDPEDTCRMASAF